MNSKTKHTHSAGGVVLNQDGFVLVVSQRGNSWSLPKGHIDPGENALQAAKREIAEESGVDQLDLIMELGNYSRYKIGKNFDEDKSEMKTIHMFLFRTEQKRLKPLDPNHPEARWVEIQAVADLLTHPRDKNFFLQVKEEICS